MCPRASNHKADTKASTSGQGAADQKAQSKEAPASKTQAQDRKAPAAGKNQAQDNKNQPAAKSAQDSKSTSKTTTGQGAAGSTQAAAAPNLTTEQKTTIRKTVIQSSSAPKVERSKINFNISVGTVVPRTVHLVAVPPTLIEIHPAWRGYRYFVVDEEVIAEVADGTTINYWTFDGTVPGPFIRVRIGDTVRVTIHNDKSSLHPHNVDFHAVTGPGGGAAATIVGPGESKTFGTVVVKYARPDACREGHESWTTSRVIPASVSGTSIASAVTPAANARSMTRDTPCSLRLS